jgi:Putative transposase, YhgA-like
MTDHDRLFKELLGVFFWEFVEAFLPEVAVYLDRSSLVFLDKEVFTDVTAGDRHAVDLVVQGRFRGQESFFLVHVEHQAQPQVEFGRRMFRYFARLHEKHRLPVYPVVIFSHDRPQIQPERYEIRFPDRRVLDFRYRVIQLRRLSWRKFVQRPNPVVCALMSKMRIAPADRPHVKLECLRLLTTLRLDPARVRLISGFIDTYLRLNAAEELRFRTQAAKLTDEQEKLDVMEIVTSWKEEGLQEGRKQGFSQKAREDVLDVLEARFGATPDEVSEKLREVQDLARLKTLLRQASTVVALPDFLRGL